MRWILSFHIIFMVCWFAGLFYLPRLFVYHTEVKDTTNYKRFCTMEYRLYHWIMTPAACLTTLSGMYLFFLHAWHISSMPIWMGIKLFCVLLLLVNHGYCWMVIKQFKNTIGIKSTLFYRFFNEIPTVLLVVIVILTVVHPGEKRIFKSCPQHYGKSV